MRTYIEEDVITDILSRLPVKSLFRFKCVSESWKTLICEPYFKKKHLNHPKNQNLQKLLIEQLGMRDDIHLFYCSSLSTSHQIVKDVQTSLSVQGFVKIYCFCDGLFLIGIDNKADSIYLLWNPSTRESVGLPHLQNFFYGNKYTPFYYGMGYDARNNEYKVLKVPQEEDRDVSIEIEILALKSGSRRKIHGDCCLESRGMDYLAFVQGAFHWLATRGVISFNISNEVFGELQLPEEMNSSGFWDQGVTELGGMLSVNCVYCKKTTIFDLWVMKEYGVKESWTKLFTMRDNKDSIKIMPITPTYIFPDGEVLLSCERMTGRTVFRTSNESYAIDDLILPLVSDYNIDEDTLWDGYAYTETLISPEDCVLA